MVKLKLLQNEIKAILSSFKTKGSFTRNFSYFLSSRVIIIVIGFLLTPIITRIYDPQAYGFFAVLNAFAINFATISCLSYESVLIIVKDESKFYNLYTLCILLITLLSGVLLVGLIGFKEILNYSSILDIELVYRNIFLLTFCSLIYSLNQIQPKWNVRRRQFKYSAVVGLIGQSSSKLFTLGLGMFSTFHSYGIILGEVTGKIFSFLLNFNKTFIKERFIIYKKINWVKIKSSMKEFDAYPKFVLPSRYLGVLVSQAPIFALTIFFNPELVGSFALATSMFNLPIILLRNTLSPLILEKLNGFNDEFNRSSFVKRIINLLIFGSLIVFIPLIIYIDILFPIIFGPKWEIAGIICVVLLGNGVFEILKLFEGPILQILRKENRIFKFNLVTLIVSAIGVLPGVILRDYLIMIIGLTFSNFLFNWFKISFALKLIKLNFTKQFLLSSTLIAISYLIKYIFQYV